MERRRFFSAVGAVAATAGAATVASNPAQASEFNWRMANLYPRGVTHGTIYGEFAGKVAEASGGRLQIEAVYDGEGVAATEVLQATSSGLVEAGLPYMALHAGELAAGVVELGLPGGPSNFGDLMTLLYKGGWEPILQDAYATLNLHYVGPLFFPGVYIITKSPVNSLADLRGLKLRAPGGYGKFVAQFGALPVTMAFSETYSALATGVIDGCCSSTLVDYRDGRFYEFANHFYPVAATTSQVTQLLINKESWDALPQDLSKLVSVTQRWHAVEQLTAGINWTVAAVKEMQEGGMVWGPMPSNDDRKQWKNAANAVLEAYKQSDPFSARLIEAQEAFMRNRA